MAAVAIVDDLQWILIVLMGVIALTAVLSVSLHAGLALAHDSLPYLLIFAWIILALAIVERRWNLVAAAAVLCAYHLVLVVPRVRPDRIPHWALRSPSLQIVVSNVYTDNATPGLLADELLSAGADIIVVTEWNPAFATEFDARGGLTAYPNRICDDEDHSEYSVCVASRIPLEPDSQIVEIGPLKMARAIVMCGSRRLHVIGLNPTAVVDPGGYKSWRSQIDTLVQHLPSFDRPIVLAGDFNTTRFRPQFRAMLRTGLRDAHDALGKGLSSSFKLAAKGFLASPGTIVRLDHALFSKEIVALSADDLEACGSDHLPFRLRIAVRQRRRMQTRVMRSRAIRSRGVRAPAT